MEKAAFKGVKREIDLFPYSHAPFCTLKQPKRPTLASGSVTQGFTVTVISSHSCPFQRTFQSEKVPSGVKVRDEGQGGQEGWRSSMGIWSWVLFEVRPVVYLTRCSFVANPNQSTRFTGGEAFKPHSEMIKRGFNLSAQDAKITLQLWIRFASNLPMVVTWKNNYFTLCLLHRKLRNQSCLLGGGA